MARTLGRDRFAEPCPSRTDGALCFLTVVALPPSRDIAILLGSSSVGFPSCWGELVFSDRSTPFHFRLAERELTLEPGPSAKTYLLDEMGVVRAAEHELGVLRDSSILAWWTGLLARRGGDPAKRKTKVRYHHNTLRNTRMLITSHSKGNCTYLRERRDRFGVGSPNSEESDSS